MTEAARRPTIVIRHVAFEDLGILEPLLLARGHRIEYRDAGVDELDAVEIAGAALLIVLGGPIGVSDADAYPTLAGELGVLAERIERGAPTLGICLGAQLMAVAMGATVAATGRKEIGYGPLTLSEAGSRSPLRHLGDLPVLHWHGDEFGIPEGTERLAGTPSFPHQAFARGAELLALQFHPEVDHRRIEQWLIGHSDELASAGIDPRELRRDAARYGPASEEAALRLFDEWLDGWE